MAIILDLLVQNIDGDILIKLHGEYFCVCMAYWWPVLSPIGQRLTVCVQDFATDVINKSSLPIPILSQLTLLTTMLGGID